MQDISCLDTGNLDGLLIVEVLAAEEETLLGDGDALALLELLLDGGDGHVRLDVDLVLPAGDGVNPDEHFKNELRWTKILTQKVKLCRLQTLCHNLLSACTNEVVMSF